MPAPKDCRQQRAFWGRLTDPYREQRSNGYGTQLTQLGSAPQHRAASLHGETPSGYLPVIVVARA
jgi:hypothetical protein